MDEFPLLRLSEKLMLAVLDAFIMDVGGQSTLSTIFTSYAVLAIC